MLFPTVGFTAFFLVFLGLWWWLPQSAPRLRASVLLLGSLVFYAAGDARWIGVLVGVGLIAFVGSRWIDRAEGASRRRRGWLIVGLILTHLIAWKYTQFAVLTRNELGEGFGWQAWALPEWAYPVGLSFFTFHALALVISVWHRRSAPLPALETLTHVSFFPALLAGPVLRADAIAPRLAQAFDFSQVRWLEGIVRICLGMTFKWVLATQAAGWADPVFQGMATTANEVWWGVHAYALQIFFDFAGYSYMAIGLALLLGFRLPENFTQPYCATSVQGFWRSWHRSLSFFFRDHLYIDTLGGSRQGVARGLLAAAFTMVVSGLWHGASLVFLVWGAWHAAALLLERLISGRDRWPAWLGWLITFEIVGWGWVWFRATDAIVARELFTQAFTGEWVAPNLDPVLWAWAAAFALVIAFERQALAGLVHWTDRIDRPGLPASGWATAGTTVVLSGWAWLLIVAGPVGVPAFIYNAF